MGEYMERELLRHMGRIEFRKSEGCLAEFAVLLLRMRQPLHETVLVDKLDTAIAFARVEQRFLVGSLAPTYPACVCLVGCVLSRVRFELGIIHKIRLRT